MNGQSEISARARAAAEAFQFGFAPDEFVVNWRDSASIYFDEFVKAVKDDRHLIPLAYFESGFCISSNPIFAMLEPKGLYCALEDIVASRRESFALLEREAFAPYVAAWTKLVQALLARFPNAMAEIQSFASKLQAALGAIRMMATVAGSARGENFERVHNLYNEMCAAFRAVGVKVAEVVGPSEMASIVEGATRRRRYERYCLSSERLAEMFGVGRETITRWKSVDSSWGQRFRNAKDSLQLMERLAREYRAIQSLPRSRRVSFDERYHGASAPVTPHI